MGFNSAFKGLNAHYWHLSGEAEEKIKSYVRKVYVSAKI
jgi:hypothetical protein